MDLSTKSIRSTISPYGTRRATAIQDIASIPATTPDGASQVNKYISLKSCRSILKELMSTEHRSYAAPFYKPRMASTDGVYYDIVKRPMDLGTVKAKFDRRLYLCSDDFVEDIRLVFANTYAVYKSPSDETFLAAKKLEKVFETLLASAPQEAISNWNDQLQALRKEVASCETGSRQHTNTKRAIKELELNLFGAKGIFKKAQAPKEVKTNADITARLKEMREEVGSLKAEILQLEQANAEAELLVGNNNMKRKMPQATEKECGLPLLPKDSNLNSFDEPLDLSQHGEETSCQPKKPLKELEVLPLVKDERQKKTPMGTVITDGLTAILKLNRVVMSSPDPKERTKDEQARILGTKRVSPSTNEENKENMVVNPPSVQKVLKKAPRQPLKQIKKRPKSCVSLLKAAAHSSSRTVPLKKATEFHLKPLHLKEALVYAGCSPKKPKPASFQGPTELSDSSSDEEDEEVEDDFEANRHMEPQPREKDSEWLNWFLSLQKDAQLSESSSDCSSDDKDERL